MEIGTPKIERETKPQDVKFGEIILTPKNVIFYSEHYKRLEGTGIQGKVRQFINHNCIDYDPDGSKYDPWDRWDDPSFHKFICRPLPGYNSTTYRLEWSDKIDDFECSCDGFQKQLKRLRSGEIGMDKVYCTHREALYMWLKMRNWNKAYRKRLLAEKEKQIIPEEKNAE